MLVRCCLPTKPFPRFLRAERTPDRGKSPFQLHQNKKPTSCGRFFQVFGGGEGIIVFFIELAVDAYPSMTTLVVGYRCRARPLLSSYEAKSYATCARNEPQGFSSRYFAYFHQNKKPTSRGRFFQVFGGGEGIRTPVRR